MSRAKVNEELKVDKIGKIIKSCFYFFFKLDLFFYFNENFSFLTEI